MSELITEFRRELMKSISKIADDEFLTKAEVDSLILKSYERAKRKPEVSVEDE
tara:strand:+ start:81 stop:239 length:159 start_codon:yes stop_codon:yes gene_type:complete